VDPADRRGTLHTPEVWEGDCRRTSVVIAEPNKAPVSPSLVVWGDVNHGVLVCQEILMPDASLQAVAESLRKAIAHPAPGGGPPRQPRRIRVSAQIAEAVRPVAESLGIELEVSNTLPLLDEVFRDFEARFGSPINQGYLDATEIAASLLEDLFATAEQFYLARPWKIFTDAEPILLECANWTPAHCYAVLLGGEGAVKGVALYNSIKDLMHITGLSPEDPDSEKDAWRTPSAAILYTPLNMLGPHRVQEAKKNGWALASRNAYPMAVCTGHGRESHWPTPA
jgi:hypothetical protein